MAREPYWASREIEVLAKEVSGRVTEYEKSSRVLQGINARNARAYQYYFGLDPSGLHATSQILRAGEDGELAAIRVNHSRALVNTLLNLITASKVVWSPKAVNIDYASLRECELAAALLEFYWTEQRYNAFANRALEEALAFTEGFVLLDWDKTAGEDSLPRPDLSGLIKTGDIKARNVSTWNVLRDSQVTNWDELSWYIVRTWENKHDLMALYPEQADKIDTHVQENTNFIRNVTSLERFEDLIPVLRFYHKKTPAIPTGRYAKVISSDCWLEDGTLKDYGLSGVPLYRVSAGELFETPYGYSAFQEILGIQELMDSLQTSIASNQSTFASQCIVVPSGSEFSPEDVVGGMKVLYVPPGGEPPKPLQLTSTPGEVFKHLEGLKRDMELVFGLNSTVRGQPQSGEQSGTALALLSSQALQQASAISANYIRFVEAMGAGVLELIRNNLSLERQVAVVGRGAASLVTSTPYTGDSFQRVKMVQVEVGNPLSQNTSGRLTIAKDLLSGGLVKSAEQYLQVMTSGKLEPLTRSVNDELLLIRGENEEIALGGNPPVLYIDDHMLHVREHRGLLANMEARKDPGVIERVMQHMKEHEQVYYTTEPALLALMGQQPPMAPPPPDLAGGQPPPEQPPGPPGTPPGGAMPPPKVPAGAAAGPEKPPGNPAVGKEPPPARMPTNPLTKQEYDTTTGGGVVNK